MLRAIQVSMGLFSLGRTGSAYITILVAIERLLVVSHPFPFKMWMTRNRGLFLIVIWLAIILTINCPWWLNVALEKNLYVESFPNTELAKFPFIFTETWFAKHVYVKVMPWDTFVDHFLPVPVLLILNGLLFYKIRKAEKRRELLTKSQNREINAARMFSKVATILFICNFCGIAHLIITQCLGTFHHEFMYFIYISMSSSSCINFFIYYKTSKYFKEKFKNLLPFQATILNTISSSSSSSRPPTPPKTTKILKNPKT